MLSGEDKCVMAMIQTVTLLSLPLLPPLHPQWIPSTYKGLVPKLDQLGQGCGWVALLSSTLDIEHCVWHNLHSFCTSKQWHCPDVYFFEYSNVFTESLLKAYNWTHTMSLQDHGRPAKKETSTWWIHSSHAWFYCNDYCDSNSQWHREATKTRTTAKYCHHF